MHPNLEHAVKLIRRGQIAGAAVGGLGGAALGGLPKHHYNMKGEKKKSPTGWRIANAAIDGVLLGTLGHDIGGRLGFQMAAKKYGPNPRTWGAGGWSGPGGKATGDSPYPDWLKGSKNKADAKKRYRDLAMKHHPDRGGNPEHMKKVNEEWEGAQAHKDFPKMASLVSFNAFTDEMFKIYNR